MTIPFRGTKPLRIKAYPASGRQSHPCQLLFKLIVLLIYFYRQSAIWQPPKTCFV